MRTIGELIQEIVESISMLTRKRGKEENLMNEYRNPMFDQSELKSVLGSMSGMLDQAVEFAQGNYIKVITDIEARRVNPPSGYDDEMACHHTPRQHDDYAYESAKQAQQAAKPREKTIFEQPAPQADTLAPFGVWLTGRMDYWSDVQFDSEYQSPEAYEAETVYNILEQIQSRFNRGADLVASHSMTQKMWDYLSEDDHLADVNLGDDKSELQVDALLDEQLDAQGRDDFRVYLENKLGEFSIEMEEGTEPLPHADAIGDELRIVLYEYDRRSFELEMTFTEVTVKTTRSRYYDGRGRIPSTAKTLDQIAREYAEKMRAEQRKQYASYGHSPAEGPMAQFASGLEQSLWERYGDRVKVTFVGPNRFEM